MSIVIRFSPELSAWILQNLNQGCAPDALIQEMRAQQMEEFAARSIVNAFTAARLSGGAVPVDSITVDDPALAYVCETPILSPGASIRTSDRMVRVAARAAQPFLAVLNNVIDAEECAALIEMARPRIKPSTVVDPATGRDIVASHRTSYGMFFRLQENELVRRLDRRFSEVMNMPVENGEGIQILYYPTGAQSAPHFDFLVPSNPENQQSLERSGQRVSTMVTYLNDVELGGETIFPEVGWTVSPLRGNAVYFEYCNSANQLDHLSLHASMPIAQGEKWVATKWMRQRRFVSAGG